MNIRYCTKILCSMLLSSMICLTAWGDDLEIYLGTGSASVTYEPNVLFIMDTSGSMTNKDGTSQSRMLRVQNALKETLSTVTNVNAGLMRFSDFGGPILYPVRPIDDPVTPEFVIPIVDDNDDAYEISGVVTRNSDTLKLSQGTNTVYAGLRYQNINIPRGAVVTRAYIRFTSSLLNTSTTSLTIRGELTDNAGAFDTSSNDISSRTTTSNSVSWNSNNDFPVSENMVSSADITSVIQEIVDQADWCGGNALNLIIEGSSSSTASGRETYAIEEGSGLSPQLVLSYDDSTATGCVSGSYTYQVSSQSNNVEETVGGNQNTQNELTFNGSENAYLGMRFEEIALPQGAEINSAYILFTAFQNRTNSGAAFDIAALDEADTSEFDLDDYDKYYLKDKAKTSSVRWNDIEAWYKNGVYQSPDLKTVVQEVVDRADWQFGNDMTLVVSNISGNRGAFTYNGQASGAPQLVITFKGNAVPGSSSTVRQHLISKVDELNAAGYTPIVDTLLEATNYYGGLAVDYGLKRGEPSVNDNVQQNTRVSHRLSYVGADSVLPSGCTEDNLSSKKCIDEEIPSGAVYISPVTDQQCQINNHIVLLSDGQANNNHSQSKISELLGKACSGSGGEKCGLDLVSNLSRSSESVIDTRVITHTIGFAANSEANNFLNQLALNGGGGFYQTDNTDGLVTAFQSILKSVKDVNATFVSPGVAVNQLNRLTHNDELYYALFKPSEGTNWPGNLKKYKIDGDTILDKNGLKAVDSDTGFFSENAQSYWSTMVDGNEVREGGAASKLDLVRKVYSFSSPGAIVVNGNEVHEDNTNITTVDLGISTLPDAEALRESVIKWSRGVDVFDSDGDMDTTDVRLQMGDPIHSQPVIINYGSDNADSAILVSTNHGFLHSFDPETGEEFFAITPKELMSNLYDFYQDNSSYSHIYGLDGDLVLRDMGTSKYLYVGMRRGGQNYYVFDVSNKTSPSLVFKVEGGSSGFEKLGQTWSRPTITKIKVGSTTRNVMIVGGGYDEAQDNKSTRSEDSVGNAVFIIDADDGSLIWSASNADANLNLEEMKYSVPARISVVDRDQDGLADHMYVVDMGAQMFRFDIYNGQGTSELVKGGLIADLGGDAAADARRFFYGPDVSEISLADQHYYAVTVGSGYRAHPLDETISDYFYMYKDTGVFNLDADGFFTRPETPITHANLYDASEHLLTNGTAEEQQLQANLFADKSGWMIKLDSGGEKVLASPLILNYQVFFTTYVPATASDSVCAPPEGNSRSYLVELINGNAVADVNNDGHMMHEDRYAELSQTGIAPDTKILIEDIVQPVVCLGTECASAVIEQDENGDPIACKTQFECLAENIYGQYERVQRSSWQTEMER